MSNEVVPELMTVPEVASRLGLCVPTVRKLIAAGEIPGTTVGGRTLIARSAVDKLVERAGEINASNNMNAGVRPR